MVDVSRRLFLGGALAIAGAAVIARPAEALAPLPRIVGDGIHDDSAGLTALLAGKPVRIENECIAAASGSNITLEQGSTFAIGSPILMEERSDITFDGNGARIVAMPGYTANHMIRIGDPNKTLRNITLNGIHFDATPAGGLHSVIRVEGPVQLPVFEGRFSG